MGLLPPQPDRLRRHGALRLTMSRGPASTSCPTSAARVRFPRSDAAGGKWRAAGDVSRLVETGRRGCRDRGTGSVPSGPARRLRDPVWRPHLPDTARVGRRTTAAGRRRRPRRRDAHRRGARGLPHPRAARQALPAAPARVHGRGPAGQGLHEPRGRSHGRHPGAVRVHVAAAPRRATTPTCSGACRSPLSRRARFRRGGRSSRTTSRISGSPDD